MLATSAMNSAVNETTGVDLDPAAVREGLRRDHHDTDDDHGHRGWARSRRRLLRGGVAAICFFAVLAVLGLLAFVVGGADVPAALLIAFAFAAAGLAVATYHPAAGTTTSTCSW